MNLELSLFEKFTEKIKTKEQVAALIDQAEQASRMIYKGKEGVFLSQKIEGKLGEEFRSMIVEAEKTGSLGSSPKLQTEFFEDLKKYFLGLPTCKLTIAFAPSEDFIAKISDWIQKQTGKRVVLDILINEEIVGGALIEFAGEYRDFSVSKGLGEVIKETRLE